ncbi:MAG: type IV secretion system DNA-binding domain-containing protein [Ruminococcus sp.]|nr:type IV secretion system DNA-binding domain-containing protein [Ruminococcus sp.]
MNNKTNVNNKTNYRRIARNVYYNTDIYKTHLNNNSLVIGSHGCGKTTMLRSNLDIIENSVVVIDTKGQLYREYSDMDIQTVVITKGSHGMVCDKIMWSMLSKTPDLDAVARAEAAAGSLNIVI